MQKDLTDFLAERGIDGLLLAGNTLCDSDMYYLSGFLAGDRFVVLASDKVSILVSGMEKGRAFVESKADEVVSTSDYGIMDRFKALGKIDEAYSSVLIDFLHDRGMRRRIGVPKSFPSGLYSMLENDLQVSIVDSPVSRIRAVKSPEEIENIKAVQRSCEAAMSAAIGLIKRSKPEGDLLYLDDAPLTSEQVRTEIEISLLKDGCEAYDTIVSGGKDSANPHARGSGPLPANAPIVLDIFPRSKLTRYFADMARTVVRGEAETEISDLYEAVLYAQEEGLKAVSAGVTGSAVHSVVCKAFEECGYPDRDDKGFIHSTGHGVGLDVHELPSLSETGEQLHAGNVVTVEPGLYYPDLGGVRLEDLVVVREIGCDNLTYFEKRLVV